MSELLVDQSVVESLKELSDDDDDFFGDLLKTFLNQSEEIYSEIIATEDADKLTKLAHKLKGSALNLGAMQLSQICQTLEHQAREGNIEDLEGQRKQLKDSLDATCEYLKTA